MDVQIRPAKPGDGQGIARVWLSAGAYYADLDPASQPGGQRLVQVALVDLAGDVAPGAADGGRIEVDGVHLGVRHGRGERGGDRARAAAQVDNNGSGAGQRASEKKNSLLDKELGTASWHEDPGLHGDPQPAELGPAEDLLQRQAGRPPLDHGGKLARAAGRGHEQPGLVLGEDAARGPQPGRHDRLIHAGSAGSEGR